MIFIKKKSKCSTKTTYRLTMRDDLPIELVHGGQSSLVRGEVDKAVASWVACVPVLHHLKWGNTLDKVPKQMDLSIVAHKCMHILYALCCKYNNNTSASLMSIKASYKIDYFFILTFTF